MGIGAAEPLHITVYDKAKLSPKVAKATEENLRRILRHSDIEVEWVAGQLSADEADLVSYPPTPRKGQEREVACRARRDIAVAIIAQAPSSLNQAILGIALPLANKGLNVRVFNDHIRAEAASRNQEHADILGHAIAHEIGHVLLRSSAHDGLGLMAGVWTSREYAWIATGSMFFSADQSKKIRASISGSGCPATGDAARVHARREEQ